MPSQTNNWSTFLSNWMAGTFGAEEPQAKLDLQSLEDRVLYSAGPVPIDFVQSDVVETGMESIDLVSSIETQFDILDDAIQEYEYEALDDAFLQVENADTGSSSLESTYELVLVDTSVEGYQELVDDILSSKSGRNVEVAYIDSGSNGIKQITDVISERSNISAIHLVTHGDDGQLAIGDTLLTQDSLAQFGDEIAAWRTSLTHDADFLIYGCNVAESDSGEAFVNELSDLLDADILASNDITGHDSLQGDWQFEYQVGDIEADLVFSADIQSSWLHSLRLVDASSGDGAASSVAYRETGQAITAFTSTLQPDSVQEDVYYAEFESATSARSADSRINTTVIGNQSEVSVAAAANGNTVFVWTSDHGSEDGVYARVIDRDGNDIRSEFQVDLGGNATNAAVDIDDAGNFVIAWESAIGTDAGDVFVSYYDFEGTLIDSTIVNSDTSGNEGSAAVALNNNGEFVVGWDNFEDSATESSYFVKKFQFDPTSDSIVAVSGDIENQTVNVFFASPDVAISERGEFVVTATLDSTDEAREGFFTGPFATALASEVVAQTYDSNSDFVSNVTVNLSTFGEQYLPSVAFIEDFTATPNDNTLLFVWQGDADFSTEQAVYFREVRFDGLGGGDEMFVSAEPTSGFQENAAIATFGDGRSAVVGYEVSGPGREVYDVQFFGAVVQPQAPTDISTGIELNTNGGNDAYFRAQDIGFDDGSGSGLDEFSVEITFSSNQASSTVPLLSYQTADNPDGLSGLFHNDFLLQYNADGTLSVYLPGGDGTTDINRLNGIDYSILMDGQQHTLAFGFDNGSNEWSVFVDGVETDSGTTSIFAGSTLNGGGELVIGQEQDTVGGSFDPDNFFSGTIHDLRIWDIKLDGAHPQSNLDLQVDSSSVPPGLIANWQFNNLVGGTEIVNVVDPTNSLQLQNVTDPGFTPGNADQNLIIDEDSPTGTHVATFDTTSPNHQETFTYQLLSDAGGRFQIDPDNGTVSVADGSLLDYNVANSHVVTVQVTDSHGETYQEDFTIQLRDTINDAPAEVVSNTPLYFVGTVDNVITNETLVFHDVDTPPSEVVFTLTSIPSSGILTLNGVTLGVNDTFTQQNIFDSELRFTHTGTSPTIDGFAFSVSDGIAVVNSELDIRIGNDVPILDLDGDDSTSPGLDYAVSYSPADGIISVFDTDLVFIDDSPEFNALKVVLTGGTDISQESVRLNGVAFQQSLGIIGSTTTTLGSTTFGLTFDGGIIIASNSSGERIPRADLELLLKSITYEHAGTSVTAGERVLQIQVEDDSGAESLSAFTRITLDSNQSPTIATNTGLTINEGDANVVISTTMLNEGDPDDDGVGLLYTVGPNGVANGVLTLNGTAIGVGDTFTQADIDAGLLAYTHNGGESTSDSFEFSLADGGEDSATAIDGSFKIDVTPVNDVPVVVTPIPDQSHLDSDTINFDISGNFSDVEGPLTFSAIGLPTGLFVDAAGNITGTIDSSASQSGPFNVTITAEDGDSETVSESFIWNVSNPAPRAVDDTFSLTEDNSFSGTVAGNDTDVDDSVTYIQLTNPANGTVSLNSDGSFNYSPQANFFGTDSFVYQIVDADGATANASVTFNVAAENDAPVAVDDSYSTDEDSTLNVVGILDNDSDVDNDLVIIQFTNPTNGTLTFNADGTFDYSPDANFFGTDSFTYQLVDPSGDSSAVATVDITVVPINDAPTTTPVVLAPVAEDSGTRLITQAELLGNASDIEGDSLTANGLTITAGNGTLIDNLDGTWSYTPAANDDSSVSFGYTISDGPDNVAGVATLDITPVNDALTTTPVVLAPVAEDSGTRLITQAELLGNANDIEGDSLTANGLTITAGNGALIDNLDGTWSYTPAANDDSSVSFGYTISDGPGNVAGVATLDITPVNDAPTAVNDVLGPIVFAPGEQLIASPMVLLENDVDEDSSFTTAEIQIISQPVGGSVEIDADGQLVFTPDSGFAGETVFEYQVIVDEGVSETARASLEVVRPVFQAPPPVAEQQVDEQVEQEVVEEQQEEEDQEARLGRPLNDVDDEDEQITLKSASANSNDFLDVGVYDSIAEPTNTSVEGVFTAEPFSATYAYASRLDSLSLVNLTGTNLAEAQKVSSIETSYLAGLVWDDLDSAKQSYLLNELEIGTPTIVTSTASFLTVGYLAWTIRGGVLLTTFMSSVPAWSSFDILSVLDAADGNDESIEQMVDH